MTKCENQNKELDSTTLELAGFVLNARKGSKALLCKIPKKGSKQRKQLKLAKKEAKLLAEKVQSLPEAEWHEALEKLETRKSRNIEGESRIDEAVVDKQQQHDGCTASVEAIASQAESNIQANVPERTKRKRRKGEAEHRCKRRRKGSTNSLHTSQEMLPEGTGTQQSSEGDSVADKMKDSKEKKKKRKKKASDRQRVVEDVINMAALVSLP